MKLYAAASAVMRKRKRKKAVFIETIQKSDWPFDRWMRDEGVRCGSQGMNDYL